MLPSSRRLLCGWLLSCLLCFPSLSMGQTELINSHVVVIGTVNLCVVTVGATDAYACNLGRTITAYQPWTRYSFIPNVANTGPAALALNGLASLPIKKLVAGVKTDLITGDIAINQPVEVYYDGTEFVWTSSAGGSGGTATTVAYRRTARSASATLDTTDGPVVECSAPSATVTLTLPTTTGTQTWFHIVKADNTAFACVIQPAATQNMNGVPNGTITLSQQWEAADFYVSNTATPNWHALTSIPYKRYLHLDCVPEGTALTTGDGKYHFPVHPDLAGLAVVGVRGYLSTVATAGGNGAVNVDMDVCAAVATGNKCTGTNRDLLSTNLTIDQNEDDSSTAAVPVVVNAANATLAANEWVRCNVDTAGATSAGLTVILTLQKP